MGFSLSNNIVKSYLKKDRKQIAVHLKSDLLIKSKTYFKSTDLKSISGSFVLSSGTSIVFKNKSWVVSSTDYDVDYNINRTTKVIQIHLYSIIDFIVLPNCVIDIKLSSSFSSYLSTNKEITLNAKGLFRKQYDERRFMSFDDYLRQLEAYNNTKPRIISN